MDFVFCKHIGQQAICPFHCQRESARTCLLLRRIVLIRRQLLFMYSTRIIRDKALTEVFSFGRRSQSRDVDVCTAAVVCPRTNRLGYLNCEQSFFLLSREVCSSSANSFYLQFDRLRIDWREIMP